MFIYMFQFVDQKIFESEYGLADQGEGTVNLLYSVILLSIHVHV